MIVGQALMYEGRRVMMIRRPFFRLISFLSTGWLVDQVLVELSNLVGVSGFVTYPIHGLHVVVVIQALTKLPIDFTHPYLSHFALLRSLLKAPTRLELPLSEPPFTTRTR